MSSSAIRAGAAYIELTLRDGVSRPLRSAAFALKDFGNSVAFQGAKVAAMGAAITAPLAAMTHSFARSAVESGRFLSRRDAANVQAYVSSLMQLSSAMGAVRDALGSAVLPLLTRWPNTLTRIVNQATAWVRANRSLVQSIARLGTVVVAAGTALVVLGKGIAMAGSVFGVLSSVASGAATVMATVGGVLAFILTPLGLVITGVVALGGYLLYASGVGQQAIEWLGQAFGGLFVDASKAWEGISAALQNGDIQKAAQVFWNFLKLEWEKGVNAVNQLWLDAEEFFRNVWSNASFDAAGYFMDAWALVQIGWQETVDFLADVWDIGINTVMKAWNSYWGSLQKGWVALKGGWRTTIDFLSDYWADFASGIQKTWNTAIGFIKKVWVQLKGLFDKDINVNAEVQRIENETRGKNAEQDRKDRERKREFNNRNPELAAIDADTARKNRGIDDRQNATIGARNQQRADRLADIRQEREAYKANLRQQREDEMRRRREEFQRRRAASQGNVDAAQQAFDQSVDEAKSGDPQKTPPPEFAVPMLREQAKLESRGSFNAMAVRGLGANSVADRTAKATETAVGLLKKIEDNTKEAAVFV